MFDLLKDKFKAFVKKVVKREEAPPEEESSTQHAEEKPPEEEARLPKEVHRQEPSKEPKSSDNKFKSSLGITKKALGKLLGKVKLEEKDIQRAVEELELSLIEGDVAFEVTEEIIDEIKEKLLGKELHPSDVESTIKAAIRETLMDSIKEPEKDLVEMIKSSPKRPFVIVFFGVNGVGKTSAIAKVAKLLQKAGLSVSIAAADTFRAAAIEQLEKHAKALGVDFIRGQYGAHPSSVAYNAIEHAKARGIDVVLIDTAGRQEVNRNLMKELEKLVRVANPDVKLFVGESIAGNALYEQVSTYNEAVGIDGVILTKLDLDPKGGTAISASKATGVPIYYVTVGQGYDDIVPFSRDWLIEKLLW